MGRTGPGHSRSGPNAELNLKAFNLFPVRVAETLVNNVQIITDDYNDVDKINPIDLDVAPWQADEFIPFKYTAARVGTV